MPGVSWPHMLRGILALSVTLFSLSIAWCDDTTTTVDAESEEVIFSEVAEDGLFFLNGKYISAPYTIEATTETLSVNGVPCAIEFQSAFGGRGSERGRGFGNRNRFGKRDRSQGQSSDLKDRSRSEFQPRPEFAIRQTARRLIESLHGDQFVLVFEQTQDFFTVPSLHNPDLLATLLSDQPSSEQIQTLSGIPMKKGTLELWNAWLLEYRPPEQIRLLLRARHHKWAQVKAANESEVAAALRLNKFSYPLTLLGMFVGVVSLGHLLRWPRKEDAREAGSESVRAVGLALWLMLGMALIDLVWTILATQAGIMKEVNPIAEKLVETPLQLAIFKTFATAVGFGIFYLWRTRRQIQVATWWMCLVCVLVTFRWVIFDSAMSP